MNIPFFNSKKIKELQQLLDQKEAEFNELRIKRELTEIEVVASGQSTLDKMIEEAKKNIADSEEKANLIIEEANLKATEIMKSAEEKYEEMLINIKRTKEGNESYCKGRMRDAEVKASELIEASEIKSKEIREYAYRSVEKASKDRDIILNGKSDYELVSEFWDNSSTSNVFQFSYGQREEDYFSNTFKLLKRLLDEEKRNFKATSVTIPKVLNFHLLSVRPIIQLYLAHFDLLVDNIINQSFKKGLDLSISRIWSLSSRLENSCSLFDLKISSIYINLKIEYLKVYFDYELYKQRKKEELAYEREMKREEEKAQREYERAIRQAEKDEEKARRLIEEAQKKLQQESLSENKYKELQQQIEKLKSALEDAVSRGERAKSMAEQTRRGYVYVISNLGSFGEDVFKIGLTRRLDPTERVDELSNASVPFPFDIHAIIESEDAPALESALHKAFDAYKLNKTNWRKEFFKVSLSEIERVVNESGIQAVFVKDFSASQYRESLSIVKAI